MSLAGSFITASVNNLDNTSGCKIIFEYAEYVFDTFEYTIHAYTEGSPNPGVSIEKVISPSDVVNNKVEWNLGVVTVVQDPAQRNQASRVAAAMANYAEFPFKLTMQAMVKTTTQNLFDDYEGNLSFKFTEASAPVVNDLYLESISEANSAVSTTFGSGVHVMTKSILSVNRDLDYAPTYKNYATQSKIVYSVGAGTDIITSETTFLSGVKGYGNYVVTATAYDSRGFSSVMRKENVLVQKWEVPHFDAVCSAARNRSSGQSPNLLCTISGMFSPIFRNSSLVNEPHMYVKFGALSGDVITDYAVNQWHTVNFPSGSYGSSGTFTMNQTTLNTVFSSEPTKNPVAFINAYSDRDLYLDFTVYDRSDFPGSFPPQPSQQGDDYIRFHIPEATPVVSLRKKKIGINKNNPTEAVDIHGNAKVDGVLTISNDPNWTPSTTQINKVWKTDSNGTPGWRDENPGGVTSVNNKTGAVTLNASDVGAPITSDLTTHTGNSNIHVTSNDKTNWNDKIASTEKGAVNGVATLGSNGKIPMSQLDDAITGNVRFQDVWNASTNTPTLPNPLAFADKGKYWITTVAGTFQGVTYNVGDWILASWTGDESTGTGSWRRVPNTDAVSSVDGLTGAVVLNDIKYTTQSLTDAQKLQARTNIGAGTSNFGGSYNDLTNKPTNVSSFTNDAGYLTQHQSLANYSTTSQMNSAISAHHDSTKQDSINSSSSVSVGQLTAYSGLSYVATGGSLVNVETAIDGKQATINDLSTIRSGASAGATAVQPATLNNYSTTSQMNSAISAHHDSTKQDSINSSSSISVGQLTAYSGLSYVATGGSLVNVETAMDLKANTSDLPVANPGEGTTTLTSLKVGNTTYNIPQGGGTVITELFVVTYGTTSHADILSAKNANKEVICMGGNSGYTNIIFRLETIASGAPAVFTAIGNDNRVYSFSVLTNNTYSLVTVSSRAAVMDTWYSDGSQTYGASYPVFARWTTVGSVSVLDFIATVSGTTGASAYDVRTHRAIKDGDGNNIASTYATKTELNGYHDSTKQDKITTSSSVSVGQLTAYSGLSYVATGGSLVDVETAIDSKYTKDANGIPESDLTTAVQAKLNTVAGNDEQRGLVTETYVSSGQMKYITNWIPSTEFLGTISITNAYYHKDLYFSFSDYSSTPSLIPFQRTKTSSYAIMPLMYVAINIVDSNKYLRIGIRQDTVSTDHIVSMHIPKATDRYLRSSCGLEAGAYYTYDESNLVT